MPKLLYIHGDDTQLLETVLTALKQNNYTVSYADVEQTEASSTLRADIVLVCQSAKDQRHLKMGGLTIDIDNIYVTDQNGKHIHLTPMEFAVLAYLVRHNNRAVSRNELLPAVWGCENHSGTRMADDTVKRLRRKLTATDLKIHTVWGYGFKAIETT